MGRPYGLGKNTTDDYSKTLSIKFLKKYGYLDKGIEYKSGGLYWKLNGNENGNIGIEVSKGESTGYLKVRFTQTGREGVSKDFDYKINLVTTSCHYGGKRWWFECPCKGNRCSILYLQSNGIFASRKTLDICYDEQKRSKKWREFSKVFPDENKAMEIYKTIKYKYRNGKETRKYKRYKKIMMFDIPDEVLYYKQINFLNGGDV